MPSNPDPAGILALAPHREMPLVCANPVAEVRAILKGKRAADLFPNAFAPEAALAGLWLYFSFFTEAHEIAHELHTPEGRYWHAIVHRQEPDAWNSGYWFRQAGSHPIFPQLREEGASLGFECGPRWDPPKFIEYCEHGDAAIARAVQMAEWRLLFAYCTATGRAW